MLANSNSLLLPTVSFFGSNGPTWLSDGGSALDLCSTACTMYGNFCETLKSQSDVIIALEQGIDHAFSRLLVHCTQPRSFNGQTLHHHRIENLNNPCKLCQNNVKLQYKKGTFWRNFCDKRSKLANSTPRPFSSTSLKDRYELRFKV